MTRKEKEILQNGGTVPPTRMVLPVLSSNCCPPPNTRIPEGFPKPLTEADYNGIPLADMEDVHRYANMDELHRADSAAADYHRGSQLGTIAKTVGVEKFKNLYKKH